MMSLNTKKKKIAAWLLASVVVVSVIGALIYSAATRIFPQKTDNGTSTIKDSVKDDVSAHKTIDKALSAELKNKYPEAIKSYQDSLDYYKSKSEKSIHDENEIANIEARLKAIDAQLQQEKTLPVAPKVNSDIPVKDK
jgi:hypothetical protein